MELLQAALIAAIVGGVLALGLRRARLGAGAVAAIALGAGFVAARLHERTPQGFPPTYVEDWGVFLVPVFVFLAVAESKSWMPMAAVWATRMVASGAVAWLYLSSLAEAGPFLIVVNGVGILALWTVLAALTRRGPPLVVLGAYGVTAGAVAIGVGLHYMVSAAQLGAALALAACAVIGVLWKQPVVNVGPATATVFVMALASVLLPGAYFTEDFPAAALVLMAACPLFAWTGSLPFLSGKSERTRVIVGAVAAIAVAAVAVWLAWPVPGAEEEVW